MTPSSLLSTIQFGYAPISSYEFDILKDDQDVRRALIDTHLYIIARRPLAIFEDIHFDKDENVLNFSISRKDIKYKLHCQFSLNKNNDLIIGEDIELVLGSFTANKDLVHGMKFNNEKGDFLFWASPERFLYLSSQNLIKLDIKEDSDDFMTFEVLYVGECTDQHIFDRFKGHHALLKILIQERIVDREYDKAHEIVIIPLEFNDNRRITIYGPENMNDLVDSMENKGEVVLTKTIALDAEKALIKCLDPRYNIEKFSNYPKSKNGLCKESIDKIVYQIKDNVKLKYVNGIFKGNIDLSKASFIGISENDVSLYNIEKTEA